MTPVIIDYGAGNVQSVKNALERIGYSALLSNDAEVIQSASHVIFPGVGNADYAMNQLRKNGLDKVIPSLKQPVLGICLGMQLMCEFSDEENTDCLGIFPLKVKKFKIQEKIPHIGWNKVDWNKNPIYENKEGAFFYFVHSYFVPISDFTIGKCTYEIPFSASIQKDNFHAVQFHPEKSEKFGEELLSNFMKI